MTNKSPLLRFNNSVQMAAIGLGVFQSPPEQTATAVESALAHGYRLIDTAASYFNERRSGRVAQASPAMTCSSRRRCGSVSRRNLGPTWGQ
jgi:diketogulonate reductase-like aldo/keto reductase